MSALSLLALFSLLAASGVIADSLSTVSHVVLFMQENRAFDHYFGTMAGVRGFNDPNVQMNGKTSVYEQLVDSTLSNETRLINNWYINYHGGNYTEASQCMTAGSNGYTANHLAYNNGLNDHWALNNTPYSWAHFRRTELPIQFALAEGWTVGDMYQESSITATNPNRVSWISGSINVPGGPQTPSQGGVYIDNNESPGCESPHVNCYPLSWKTVPEYYSAANVSWQVFQDSDNFDDNPLAWFKQFQEAAKTSDMYKRGMTYKGLSDFYKMAAAGTLPAVSYIIGPAELSEHPPYQPKDGAWLQRKVAEAVITSPKYNETVLIISYDETGGWGDHVIPYHSPAGTPGEWLEDPYGLFGETFSGPGFRVPFYIISPWTRSSAGGNVFTEHADHSSQIKFIEAWQASLGVDVVTTQIPAWRRAQMSDLVSAFDFANPDLSLPVLPTATTPSKDPTSGAWNGYATCEATYANPRPPVPYSNQTAANTLTYEEGFKSVRGALTEGRYLTLEMDGFALQNSGAGTLEAGAVSYAHSDVAQRFVVQQLQAGGDEFLVKSAVDGRFVTGVGTLTKRKGQAATFVVKDLGNASGYSLMDAASGKYWGISAKGRLVMGKAMWAWALFSVTYNS